MRVITGTARGRKLKELSGMETRPTTDRVKEAMFSIIQFELEGRRVLDLFSGTGQLGIEALSRGAEHCVFVDIRREAVSLIRDNLAHTGLTDRAKVVQGDYLAYLTQSKETFDVILLDPPYGDEIIKKALQTITRIDKLSENGIIICENGSNFDWPSVFEPYALQKEYQYGRIKLALYRRSLGAAQQGTEQGVESE